MADWNDIEARRQAREEREQNAVQSLFNAIALQLTPEQEQHVLSWISSVKSNPPLPTELTQE